MANKKKSSSRHRKHKKRLSAFVMVLVTAIIFGGCIYITYTKFSESSPYIKAETSPSPAAIASAPSASPSVAARSKSGHQSTSSPPPTEKSEIKKTTEPYASASPKSAFTEYADDLYGFSCPYPSNFSEYSGEDTHAVMSLRAPEGSAYEHIFANESSSCLPTTEMRDFISSYPTASIIENRAGSDYYYALIKYDDMYIYRYAAYTDDTEKGFEFGYSENTKDTYSKYPEEIKDNFILY